MHSWLTRTLVSGAVVASAAGAITTGAFASAAHPAAHHSVRSVKAAEAPDKAREAPEQPGTDRETGADAAKQSAACQKAGVSGENVNYDGQSGSCTTDGNSGPDSQQG